MSSNIAKLSSTERAVYGHLRPMFPQLSDDVLRTSLQHPSNRHGDYDEFILLERCIDDLLVLRTQSASGDTSLPAEFVDPVIREISTPNPEDCRGHQPAHSAIELPPLDLQFGDLPAPQKRRATDNNFPFGPGPSKKATRQRHVSCNIGAPTDKTTVKKFTSQESLVDRPATKWEKNSTPNPAPLQSTPVPGPTVKKFTSQESLVDRPAAKWEELGGGDRVRGGEEVFITGKISTPIPPPLQSTPAPGPTVKKFTSHESLVNNSVTNKVREGDTGKAPSPLIEPSFKAKDSSRVASNEAGPSNIGQTAGTFGGARPKVRSFLASPTSGHGSGDHAGPSKQGATDWDDMSELPDLSDPDLFRLLDTPEDAKVKRPQGARPKDGVVIKDTTLTPLATKNPNVPLKDPTPPDLEKPGTSTGGTTDLFGKPAREEDCLTVYYEESHRAVHLVDSSSDSSSASVISVESVELPEMTRKPRIRPPSLLSPRQTDPHPSDINRMKSSSDVGAIDLTVTPNRTVPKPSTSSAGLTRGDLPIPAADVPVVARQESVVATGVEQLQALPELLAAPLQAAPQADLPAPPLPPPPPKQKSPEDILDEQTENVCCMFPKADPAFIRQQLKFALHQDPVTVVCNYLLENPSHPKKAVPKSAEQLQAAGGATAEAASLAPSQLLTSPSPAQPGCSSRDYYKDYMNIEVGAAYKQQALELLKYEFTKVPLNKLKGVLRWFDDHYAPTRKLFMESFSKSNFPVTETYISVFCDHTKVLICNVQLNPSDSLSTVLIEKDKYMSTTMKPLKCGRHRIMLGMKPEPELLQEIQFISQQSMKNIEEGDQKIAEGLNEQEYEAEGQTIECGCCFGDCTFDTMVQCYEGHLFCQSCLHAYVKEAAFGEGKTKLGCLGDGCDAGFPKSELLRACPSSMLDKFEEKLQEQSLNMANIEDLVRCPKCDFAAALDPSDKVFKCQKCSKETCRYCKEDWDEHFGIPCEELEKKDETKLRLKYEERMTEAKIRFCQRCKAGFTKTDGCNKMTCPCGAKMCYICRKPNIDYNHFCNHVRDPGKSCTKCTACSLWTNPEEDDERALREIKKEATQARHAEGFSEERMIGAPDDLQPKAKKPRVH